MTPPRETAERVFMMRDEMISKAAVVEEIIRRIEVAELAVKSALECANYSNEFDYYGEVAENFGDGIGFSYVSSNLQSLLRVVKSMHGGESK